LGLALPIGALANAANVSLTLEGSWGDLDDHPGLSSGVAGLYLAVAVGTMAAMGGFRSVAAVTSLTAFWEGIEYALIGGVGALLVAGVAMTALPRLVGRGIPDPGRVRAFNRLTIMGSVGVLVFLGAAGLLNGYSWIGGANTASFASVGEGWGAAVGASGDTLLLLALVSSIIAFTGHLAYASTIFGTIVKGTAMPQEVLVSVGPADE
jgi:cbb3-type cytochrome oxidase subunit 1